MKRLYRKPSVDLELTGTDVSASLNKFNEAGITFLRVNKIDEITYLIKTKRKYLKTLYLLSEKQGDSLRVLHTSLIYRMMSIIKQHITLISILLILCVLAIIIPSRVFFIRVAGNSRISDEEIIAAAENCGLNFGMRRRDIRNEKIKNQMLMEIPLLQWVGVNTKGCVAVINVRERFDYEAINEPEKISNIIASADGFILNGTANKGTALFYEGQSVQKGQILISAYTDCGQYLKAVQAEGDVFAQTSRNMTAISPVVSYYRTGNHSIQKKYSLIVGKKRINLLKDSGISDVTCGRIYKEYKMHFPGDFDVPVALCVETLINTDIQQKKDFKHDRTADMRLYLDSYLSTQMIAGKIIYSEYNEDISSDISMILGSYICHEMIGREKTIEFGDFNGENG